MVSTKRMTIGVSSVLILILLFASTFIASHANPSSIPQAWHITPDDTHDFPDPIVFTVTFNQGVSGVDTADFYVSGHTQTASIQRVEATDNPAVYTVWVTRTKPSPELLLVLSDNDSIISADGTPLGGVGTQNGNAISTAHRDETLHTTISASSLSPRIRPRAGDEFVGEYSSIALTSADLPVISYYDGTNTDLKLAICADPTCTSATISTIDSTNQVGEYASLALTATDIPVMSYYDGTNGDLKLAVCNNVACTSPTISTVDATDDVGFNTSIALTSAGAPVISYFDRTNSDLKLAICDALACTSPTLLTIDSTGFTGRDTSVALTSADVPVISYLDENDSDLKIAICNDTACSSPTISTLDSVGNVGIATSLALTSTDIPFISYYDRTNTTIKLARCNDTACSSPTLTTVDTTGDDVGRYNSLALTSAGVPVISYYDDTNIYLKLAMCDDAACASPLIFILDVEGTGLHNSIALTSNDVPIISHLDDYNGNIKLYHGATIVDQGQPNSFAKLTPATNGTVSSTTATLTWDAVLNASDYEYCIATSATTCTSWTSTGTDTTASVTGLSHNTTYYWHVRATNTAGTTLADGGTVGRFKIVLTPVAFNKTSPANNAKNQPTKVTLKWAASTRATSYEYCIALTQAACTNWKSVGTRRTVTVTGLAKGKTYFWQIRAKNAGGTTISSGGYRKFTTKK